MNTEVDRADAAAHRLGRFQLHQRLADHHADHVGRAGDGEHHDRQRERSRARSPAWPRRRRPPPPAAPCRHGGGSASASSKVRCPAPTAFGAARAGPGFGGRCRMSWRTSAAAPRRRAARRTGPARSRPAPRRRCQTKRTPASSVFERGALHRGRLRARSAAPAPARRRARRGLRSRIHRRRAGHADEAADRPAGMMAARMPAELKASARQLMAAGTSSGVIDQPCRQLEGLGADGDGQPEQQQARLAGRARRRVSAAARRSPATPCRRARQRAVAGRARPATSTSASEGRNCISPTGRDPRRWR